MAKQKTDPAATPEAAPPKRGGRAPKNPPPRPETLAPAAPAQAPIAADPVDPGPPPGVPLEAEPWKLEMHELDVNLIDLDPNNVNEHTDDSLKGVEESLVGFGQQKPVVVVPSENGRYIVIAGNATLRQARKQNWPRISAVVSRLRGDDAMAYAIADNRTARLSTWNYKALQVQLRGLAAAGYHMPKTGWFGGELGNMINTSWTPPTPSGGDGTAGAASDKDKDEDEDDKPVIAESIAFTKEEWAILAELKSKMGMATEKGAVLMLAQKALGPG